MNGKSIQLSISFVALVSLIVFFSLTYNSSKSLAQGEDAKLKNKNLDSKTSKKVIPVKISKSKMMTFVNKISVHGKAEAKYSVMVPLRCGSVIEHLYVDEGDIVKKGDTLFENDNYLLKQSVDNARQVINNLVVEDKQRLALLEIAKVNLAQQQKDFKRYLSLVKNNSISQEKYEIVNTAYKRAKAQLDERKQFLKLGREQAKQAVIALKIAKKNLSDSTVKSPINGVVVSRLFEEGEMGKIGKPVFKIENQEVIEISAFIPAEFISKIIPDKTFARISFNGKVWRNKVKVTYVNPSIDPHFHMFEIKCLTDCSNESGVKLHPGQSVSMEVELHSEKGIGVPTETLIRRKGGYVVFTVSNGVAVENKVTPELETDGYTEIVNSNIQAGDQIVSMGQFLLNNNTKVIIEAK